MGKLIFLASILLLASLFWWGSYQDKKEQKNKLSTDDLLNQFQKRISEIEKYSSNLSEEAKKELEYCKSELNKLKTIKKQLKIK